MGGAFELRPRRQAQHFDDARVAHFVLHAKGVAHRTRDHLQLGLILRGKCHQHDEECDQQTHQVREGHEPAVTAAAV